MDLLNAVVRIVLRWTTATTTLMAAMTSGSDQIKSSERKRIQYGRQFLAMDLPLLRDLDKRRGAGGAGGAGGAEWC
ncbi:hypothetical protein E4U54_006208 [Claviceps lovelessii]|nr:hypothetical protein E4U54_006208 [Claviceps lovelessii]